MQATVTDDLELILRWHSGGESTIRFSIASSSEFTISAQIVLDGGVHYQGQTRITFQTMCYGYDLDNFATELRKLAQGESASARFMNTGGDLEIQIVPQDRAGQTVFLTDIRYRQSRTFDEAIRPADLLLPVGLAVDVLQTAQATGEVLRLLKVDCRNLFELPPNTET